MYGIENTEHELVLQANERALYLVRTLIDQVTSTDKSISIDDIIINLNITENELKRTQM